MPHYYSKIIHIDLDYFFAQVEELDNQHLKDKPFAIGGPGNRGVLSTCNYVARKFGVKSGMPTFKALEVCPTLILLPGSMQKYRQISQKIFSILHTITDQVESMSLDEAYIDVSNVAVLSNDAIEISDFIRKEIFTTTGLTCSAGIAPNKLLAKIASDMNKPNGVCVIEPNEIDYFISKLKVEKLMGVGKATLKKLHAINIYTCQDLQQLSIAALQQYFGKYGLSLYNYCRGIDTRPLQPYRIEKSISVESTPEDNLYSLHESIAHLQILYSRLEKRIHYDMSKKIDGLFVKITSTKFLKYSIMHKSKAYDLEAFVSLFKKLYQKHNTPILRLIGIGVTLKNCEYTQLNFNFSMMPLS